MGSIYKKKGSPYWQIQFYANGKPHVESSKSTVHKEAKALLSQREHDAYQGKVPNKKSKLFKNFADSWIDKTIPTSVRESTADEYRTILEKQIRPVFDDQDIAKITEQDVLDFLQSKLKEGKSRSTVGHYRAVLGGIFTVAKRSRVIATNPAHDIGKIGNQETAKRRIIPLSREELKVLLDTVRDTRPDEYPRFLFMARTGCRGGEMCGLQWGDLDLENRSVLISRTFSKGRLGGTKNKKDRTVDLSKQITETLLDLRPNEVLATDFVFPNGTDRAMDLDHWRARVFTPMIRQAGVTRISTHGMRHTYTSLRIEKGDSIVDIASDIGDDPAIVLKNYAHKIPKTDRDKVDELDD